jgi:hypothetical protein
MSIRMPLELEMGGLAEPGRESRERRVQRTRGCAQGTHRAIHGRYHNIEVVLVQDFAKSLVSAHLGHVLKSIAVLRLRRSVLNSPHKP